MKRRLATVFLTLTLLWSSVIPGYAHGNVSWQEQETAQMEMDTASQAANVSVWDGNIASGFAGGSGTAVNPYRITTASQLAYLAQLANNSRSDTRDKYFRLETDVDLNHLSWTPIGNEDNSFGGSFLGNGHVISNLYINTSAEYQGLFGKVFDGSVEQLTLTDVYVCGGEATGALAGYLYGNVTKCSVSGVVTGTEKVGGIVGLHSGKTISECSNSAKVSATGNYVGGITGWGETVRLCINTGKVNTTGKYLGGIVGNSRNSLTDCFNYGAVGSSTASYVGGIIGMGTTVSNCGNAGIVTGSSYIGGVCGHIVNGSILYVWNAGKISYSGQKVGGIVGYAQSSSIKSTFQSENCGVSVVCGFKPAASFANSFGENTQVNTAMNTAAFASRVNAMIDTDVYTQWSQDDAMYDGYPYIELRTVTGISITKNPDTLVYYPGTAFDTTGMVVTVTYDDGTSGTTKNYAVTPSGALSKGTTFVMISCKGYTARVAITVKDIPFAGSGTQEDPYRIRTEEDLRAVAALCNGAEEGSVYPGAYYRQEENIALSAQNWTPIGRDNAHAFSGTYDGSGYTISGLTIQNAPLDAALFGVLSGTVSLLTLKDARLTGNCVGGIAAMLSEGKIMGCAVENLSVMGEPTFAGGVVAIMTGGGVANCTVSGSLNGTYVGGVAAVAKESAVITLCDSSASIIAQTYGGGLVGSLASKAGINNSINTGAVCSATLAGGICAQVSNAVLLQVNNYGTVSSTAEADTAGGIAAAANDAVLEKCSNFGVVTAGSYAGGIVGYAKASDADLQINTCLNQGTITAGSGRDSSSGGITGTLLNGTVINCVNEGAICATYNAGGIVGQALSKSVLFNSINTGSVSGIGNGTFLGGVVGYAGSVAVSVSCNTGDVASSNYSGAVAGNYNRSYSSFSNCYYRTESASKAFGYAYSGDSATKKSSADMKTDSFCTTLDAAAVGTDCSKWVHNAVTNGGYPVPGEWFLQRITELRITTKPTKTAYEPGQTLNLTGLVVTAALSNGGTADVTALCSVESESLANPGEKNVVLTLDGQQVSFQVLVYGVTVPVVQENTAKFSYSGETGQEQYVLATYGKNGNMIKCMVVAPILDGQLHTVIMKTNGAASAMVFRLDENFAPLGEPIR